MQYKIKYREEVTGIYHDTLSYELKIIPNENEAKSVTIWTKQFSRLLGADNIEKLTQLHTIPIRTEIKSNEVIFYYRNEECGRIREPVYHTIEELQTAVIDVLKQLEEAYRNLEKLYLKTHNFEIDINI